MNRELKFRIWLHDAKEWGDVSCLEVFNTTGKLEYLYQDQLYTIQQYTGLKDSKGVDIYEGDIVVDRFKDYYEVRWSGCGWKPFTYYGGGEVGNTECHVDGNIFENSDLLKQQ